jgi:signal transduction histidine kinase
MQNTETFFAPAGRAAKDLMHDQSQAIKQADFVAILLDAMPTLAMILNEHRQIAGVNNHLLQAFAIKDADLLIGRRPGEALGCIHSDKGPDGCGTAINCSVCGAVKAILDSQKSSSQISGECLVTLGTQGGTALELEATASPLQVAGNNFTIFALNDISAKKRKQLMERTFFHDIINTAGGIRGLACLLVDEDPTRDAEKQYQLLMKTLSGNLIEEIRHQRRLIAAEEGEYVPQLEEVDLRQMLQEISDLYTHHERVPGRFVEVVPADTYIVNSDPPVLRRIVGNMVLNAMEAIAKGETVLVSYHPSPESLRIEVSNPGEMPLDIQLKVFQRSFSSKAAVGRGIGTYSMKLFGERYLGGKVGFNCADGRTTFFIELPRTGEATHPG